jgi:glycosyltransferase involved in cell wall biosynthesis
MISVVIPTYNRQDYIERAIVSVLNQTRQASEILVVDDASTDGTDQVMEHIISRFPQAGVQFLRSTENRGAQVVRNRGIREANGEWIALLDSDDEWLPNHLEISLLLAETDQVNVVYGNGFVEDGINKKLLSCGQPARKAFLYSNILSNAGPMFQSMLVRKSCFEKIGFLDENIIAHQEWDTAIRLFRDNEVSYVDEPVFIWHIHQAENISGNVQNGAQGVEQIIEKHKDEILEVLGPDSLAKHYNQLAYRYFRIGSHQEAKTSFVKSEAMATDRIFKFVKKLQCLFFTIPHFPVRLIDPYYLLSKIIKSEGKYI